MKVDVRRILSWSLTVSFLSSCAMSEEMRRIQNSKRAQAIQDASRSGYLTGEQLFMRSCNTCHPGGDKGFGPALDHLSQDFPTDAALSAFIRKGKGNMPAQPKNIISDGELDSLVQYLRALQKQ